MTRKIAIVIIVVFSLSNHLNSQTKIYVDENLNKIDSLQYDKKCKNFLLKCYDFDTDSLKIKKVLYKHSFGKISENEYHQLKLLLMQKTSNKINSNSILFIRYIDTLYNYEIRKKNYDLHVKQHEKSIKESNTKFKRIIHGKFQTLKRDKNKISKYVKNQKKCIHKFRKISNTDFYNIYNLDFGDLAYYKGLNYIKSRGIFKRMFFQITYNNYYLVIKPDGEYFLNGSHLSNKKLEVLLKNSDWTEIKKDWINSYNSNSENGIGFFEREKGSHKPHCF